MTASSSKGKNKQIIIQADKYYTVQELHVAKLFPWCRSYGILRSWLQSQEDVFEPFYINKKNKSRPMYKGEYIIKYLKYN